MEKHVAAVCLGNIIAAMFGVICMMVTGFYWSTFLLTIANIAIFCKFVWMACKTG